MIGCLFLDIIIGHWKNDFIPLIYEHLYTNENCLMADEMFWKCAKVYILRVNSPACED